MNNSWTNERLAAEIARLKAMPDRQRSSCEQAPTELSDRLATVLDQRDRALALLREASDSLVQAEECIRDAVIDLGDGDDLEDEPGYAGLVERVRALLAEVDG